MAKPNYQFEKRQRELAKKKKKEEKLLQRRSGGTGESAVADADQGAAEGENTPDNAESGDDDQGTAPQAEASA